MEAEKRLEHAHSIDGEAERVRDIFVKSFPQSDGDLDRLLPRSFTSTLSQRGTAAQAEAQTEVPIVPDDEFDWAITLANVETVVEAAHSGRVSLLAAERRAELAEAKAEEALHWLKALHRAVLKGLPGTASNTAAG